MNEFVQRNASAVIGILNGFDRLLFRGTLRRIASASGLSSFLSYTGVLLKDFADHSMELTEQMKSASLAVAKKADRPVQYLADPSVRKEDLAWEIARRDKIQAGLVCVFTAVEPCWSFEMHRDRANKKLQLRSRQRRCLHLYHYMIHPLWGFMHIRMQSWFPFTVGVCINGREWLSRQMDQAGLAYVRRENCFTDLKDVEAAQALMDQQLKTDWKSVLDGIVAVAHPAHAQWFGPQSGYPIEHYWSAQQSEWVNGNSIKMYDKQGSVLRFETTINRTDQFKVYRGTEEDPEKLQWRKLRKGIADLHRRAQVSQACNERYTHAMAAVEQTTPLKKLARPLCLAVKKKGRRARALNPLSSGDATLLAAVIRGEFAINGLRNRDIRALLYPSIDQTQCDKATVRRQSAAVGRKLALLRLHGLIRKVPKTHRYQVTDKGHLTITALLAAAEANAQTLAKAA